jgi:F-box domain
MANMVSLEYRVTLYDDLSSKRAAKHDIESNNCIPSHPLGVRPNGNAFVQDSAGHPDLRPNLGLFSRLPDELISHFVEYLDVKDVLIIGGTCKAFYAFTTVDEIWRKFFEEYDIVYMLSHC